MYLTNFSLKNFRSYSELDLTFTPGITIFIGRNGEGKTNIVEAILYLSFLTSHRTASDQPLVKLGENSAYIRASVSNNERDILVELEINSDKANRARINQNPIRSTRELFGIVQAIYFSPEDLDLVRGDPSERRRYIDQLLILRNPRLAGVMTDYERALRQRNSLLKSRANYSSLESWDQQVAHFGGEIMSARLTLLGPLNNYFSETYNEIAPNNTTAIQYKSSIENVSLSASENTENILQKMREVRQQEIDRGITLVGPHRDDLILRLGDHLVKGYASHGESWTVALCLKMAAYKLLVAEGLKPILILDDVFSELDEERRGRLVELAQSAEQTFITVAVEGDLPPNIQASTYQVKSGTVKVKS